MQAGFSQCSVMPPLGSFMEGLGQKGKCERVHDELWVRALYLRQEQDAVLILGFDLLFFERDMIDRLKGAIGLQLDLAPRNILLNTSHTHAGPRLTHWAYSGEPDPVYMEKIVNATVQASVSAFADCREVTVRAGQAKTDVPVSRRHPDADGQVFWAPYFAGSTCQALPYCIFTDTQGEIVSALFSVSCHPSMIYSLDFSADYPGAAIRELNQKLKTRGALFLQGAGGDTKPRRIAALDESRWNAGSWDDMAATGNEIAAAILADLPQAEEVTPKISCCSKIMQWPLEPAPDQEGWAAIKQQESADTPRYRWVEEMQRRQDVLGGDTAVPVELQIVQLAENVRLVGVEGELVGELGNLIIRCCGSGVTFPLGYTNGARIYLPSDRMLPEKGYEVTSYWEYHWPAPLASGIDQRLADAVTAAYRNCGKNRLASAHSKRGCETDSRTN